MAHAPHIRPSGWLIPLMGLLLAQLPPQALSQSAPPGAADAPYAVIDVQGGGQIKGTVTFEGETLPARVYEVSEAAKVCGARKESQPTRVDGKALADVVVTLRGLTQGKAPGDAPAIQVQQCELVPRIQGMMAGQRLTLRNLDDLPHRVTGSAPGGGVLFDFFQPMQGSKHRKKIDAPGLVRVQADADMPWAVAWVYVAPHPYVSISDGAGRFALVDIPPGTYELLAWHEVLGTYSAPVEVKAGESLTLDIPFEGGQGGE